MLKHLRFFRVYDSANWQIFVRTTNLCVYLCVIIGTNLLQQQLMGFFVSGWFWDMVSDLYSREDDAVDNWCIRRILHIHWTDFVSNDVVRSHTGQPLLSDICPLVLLWSSMPCWHWSRPLPSSPDLHSGSSQRLATKNWKTEANVAENVWGWSAPLNFGLAMARWRALDRPAWRLLVDAATSSWHAPERERVGWVVSNIEKFQLDSLMEGVCLADIVICLIESILNLQSYCV